MKRLIAVLLVALLLVGCGKQEPAAEAESAAPAATTATEAATEAAETEASTEETAPEVTESSEIRHPLTGELLDAPFTGDIIAVVVNNIVVCQPQHGISQADIFYEVETEGGITRNLAVFTELSDVEKLGPIRSARTYFNAIARSYQAPLVHCSAGRPAKEGYVDNYVTQLPNWEHIDAGANGSYFYRDQARLNSGLALEHTLFTTGEGLMTALNDKAYNNAEGAALNYQLQFAETPAMGDTAATEIKVSFKGGKDTYFSYDAETGLYGASQYGGKHVDGNTKEMVTYRNVMVLCASQTKLEAYGANRSFYELIGEGNGYMACDGKIVPIKWNHASYEDPFTYTLEDGTPLQLGVGRTYIGISGASNPISYE